MRVVSSVVSLIPATLIFAYVLAVVALTMSGVRFPSDGVYYHAVADHFLATGSLADATLTPPGEILTHQFGIVFLLIPLKGLLGGYWWIGFICVVAFLWWKFTINFHDFIRQKLGRKNEYTAVLISILPLLHQNTFLTIGTFQNESVFLPLLWLFLLRQVSILENSHPHTPLRHFSFLSLGDKLFFIFIAVCGIFFRVQTICFTFSFLFYLYVSKRISFAAALAWFLTPLLIL